MERKATFVCVLLAAIALHAQGPTIPITELGTRTWNGFEGGLYPQQTNRRPAQFDSVGQSIARSIQPLDTNGNIDAANGRVGFISIGMSNCSQEFSVFKNRADTDPRKNPRVSIVNCAQGGQTAERIIDTVGNAYWRNTRQFIRTAGLTDNQIQVAWLKEANINPRGAFPIHAQTLEGQLKQIVAIAKAYFPNLKLIYVASRIYAGYGPGGINPEPYAYESAFSVKWLVEDLMDEGNDPWVAWGPYLWANGTTPRADGLTYAREDLAQDGIHPSEAGRAKVAQQLLDFFVYDPTTTPWFVAEHLHEARLCDSIYVVTATMKDDGVFPGDVVLEFQNEGLQWFAYPILHCKLEPNPYFIADTNMNVVSIFDGRDGSNGGLTTMPVHMQRTTDVDEVPNTFQLRGTATIQFQKVDNSGIDTCTFAFSLAPGKLTTTFEDASMECISPLQITPNPAVDQVVIAFSAIGANTIEIVSQEGVVIYRRSVDTRTEFGTETLYLNTADLASGSYLVHLRSSTGLLTSRFVVLR